MIQEFSGSPVVKTLLPLQGAWVWSLIWGLRSCMPHIMAKKKKNAAAATSLQSCPTLCDPIDGSPPGSPVHGILQARILEWVAISFSSAWKWKVKVKSLSRAQLLATPWTTAHQAPPSMGFSRQEHWSGVPLPSPKIGQIYTYLRAWESLCHNQGDKCKPKDSRERLRKQGLRRGWQSRKK